MIPLIAIGGAAVITITVLWWWRWTQIARQVWCFVRGHQTDEFEGFLCKALNVQDDGTRCCNRCGKWVKP